MSNAISFGQTKNHLFPVMNVIDYPFMHKISELIKHTDMNSTYPKEVKERSNILYSIKILDIKKRHLENGEFLKNGSYYITVCMDPVEADNIQYKIFNIDDIVFASEYDLFPFFNSCNITKGRFDKKMLSPLITGGVCLWHFVVLKGNVIVAVYYCIDDCVCEDDVRIFDLLRSRKITVREYENLYPGLYY